MKENRGPWYLITGFVLGLILGVAYSWIMRPVQYVNTSPASLRADFKNQYRALIASAYAANGDLVRARGRLSLLQDEDIFRVLAAQAQQTLADGNSSDEARALGLLAVAIGQDPSQSAGAGQPTSPNEIPALPVSPTLTGTLFSTGPMSTAAESLAATATPTPTLAITSTNPISGTLIQNGSVLVEETSTSTPTNLALLTRTATPTRDPTATGTLLPTRTTTATPGAPYILDDQQKICEPEITGPLIQVIALDAAGTQVPGVEAIATWSGGEELFYTGLKPELGSGYADIEIMIGITYTLRLAGAGQSVPDLTAFECEDSGGQRYWGSWLLTFVQP